MGIQARVFNPGRWGWRLMMRSLASDWPARKAQKAVWVWTERKKAGLTGDLQRDAPLLGLFRHAVVRLTTEPSSMVFRSNSHDQHAVSHCLGMLCAPSYGHWLTVLDTEASLVMSVQLLPHAPRPPSILTFSHCRVAGGFPPLAMQGSSRFSPARTCPSLRPGQSMTGGPGGTGERTLLREPGETHLLFLGSVTCFNLLLWTREMTVREVLGNKPNNLTSNPFCQDRLNF